MKVPLTLACLWAISAAIATASPLQTAPPVSTALPQRGEPLPRKPTFGAQIAPPTAEEAKAAGLEAGQGFRIVAVLPGQTAANLKMEPNDVLLELAGKPIRTRADLNAALADSRSGDSVLAVVFRGGKRVELRGNLQPRPLQKPDGFEVSYDQVISNGKRIRIISTTPDLKKPAPTIFWIGGIGAYSMDGDYAGIPYGNIMGPLAKQGYTIIRIDKPGQGDSEGPAYLDLLFDTELDAYRQALRLAKTFPFVDKDRIAIVGHSMGGAFAPLLAAEEPVAAVAVSGTMSKTWTEYNLENTRRQLLLGGAPAGEVDKRMRDLALLCGFLFVENKTMDEIRKERPTLTDAIRSFSPDGKTMSGVNVAFFQQLAQKNLAEAWSKIDGHALALWGENEFISTEYDHQLIAEIVNKRNPGKGTYIRVPQSDHGFNQTTSTEDSFRKWGRPGNTFNPNIIPILGDWLGKVLKS